MNTEMRGVDFHLADGIVLGIERLRGRLLPSLAGGIPTFDRKESFALDIQTARITVDTLTLTTLLNKYVFGYGGSPLTDLRVGVDGNELVQTGILHKGLRMRFRIQSTMSLMPDGRIRLHPTNVRVGGIGMQRIMRITGIKLDQLIKLQPGRGAAVDGNDFILDPLVAMPPPRIRGRMTTIGIENGRVVQTFGDPHGAPVPLFGAQKTHRNYMYFRGGVLQFGKLTMRNTDLAIVDQQPADVFDFSLDRYNDQLVAGYSRSTPVLGLVVFMPDLHQLGSRRPGIPRTTDSRSGRRG